MVSNNTLFKLGQTSNCTLKLVYVAVRNFFNDADINAPSQIKEALFQFQLLLLSRNVYQPDIEDFKTTILNFIVPITQSLSWASF